MHVTNAKTMHTGRRRGLHSLKPVILAVIICCVQIVALAQTTVKGTIKNEKGEPVPSVSVKVKNAQGGTQTDMNGAFSLTVPDNATLVLSSIGYENQEIKAGSAMNITMKSLGTALTDVVVIGYGTQKKKELTGAISTVTSKDFQTGVIVTPEQLIAGKVAGVSITTAGGAPGSAVQIRIRGGASLNASNDPLLVIDGLPLSNTNIYGTSNPLSLVNPNDIESFTVLKDAASTAIYGSRASNGVIIVTTKKGRAGKPTYNFSSQVSAGTISKYVDVLSAAQFRGYVDSLGTAPQKALMGKANTNWQKEIYQTAIGTDNNISVVGGSKALPVRVSAGYLNQQGILKTDKLERGTAAISLSPRLFDNHLKIDLNLKGAVSKTRFANNAAIAAAVQFDPTQPVYTNNKYGNYFEWETTDQGVTSLNKLATRNPVSLLELYNNNSNVQRSFGNAQFDYSFHFLPELHANLNLGYDVGEGKGTVKVPAYAAQNYLDSGQNNQYKNKISNKMLEFYFNYTKDLASIKSTINATAGYGYYNNNSTNYNYPSVRANGNIIPGTEQKYPFAKPENTILSYYGRLIYTYNTKYILAASLRTDGSSKFAKENRWGVFPSAAFTWRMAQEEFLKNSKAVSDLNLRLSYGITGNQDGIDNYPYQLVFGTSDNSSMVKVDGTYINMATPTAVDPNIRWEQTASYDAGLDYGFLNNRITGSLDFYFKKTKDLLNKIPVPAGSNFGSELLTNVGNVENKGVELTIGATPVKTKDFSWDVNFNVAYNDIKITNLTASKDSSFAGNLYGNGVQINSVGYSPGAFYVWRQLYSKEGKPVEGVYEDKNGDNVINQSDYYRYKTPFPKWIMGFTTNFNYRKWTLSTTLRANIGNYMYNNVAAGLGLQKNIINPLGYLGNSTTDVLYTGFVDGQTHSDYYVQNASFLKMDNLGVSYKIGRVFNNRMNMTVRANCQNVFTVTKYTGLDPEISGGYDNNLYPRPRTYILGINLQF
ncbi:SusC/RagA family TonB-linked outer membrane protein [Pinibacter aurantiacus]|nr:TonB-dependent receptor [Pinibacter aurantiacus]